MNVNEQKIVKPKVISIETIDSKRLFQIIDNDTTVNSTTQCLAELLRRNCNAITELDKKFEELEKDIAKMKSLSNSAEKEIQDEKYVTRK